MNAEIITIGDEILIGQIIDTNSAYIADKLNLAGIKVIRKISISDDNNDIKLQLKKSIENSDIVIVTGGLGPTKDDKTKQSLCELFNTQLVFNETVLADIQRFISERNSWLNEPNRSQAYVPECAEILRNPIGTAPGLWFNVSGKILVCLPGVPFEMEYLLENEVLPKIKKQFTLAPVLHKTIITTGTFEAHLAELLTDFEKQLPPSISLAYLPSPGIVRLRLSVFNASEQSHELIQEQIKKIEAIIGKYIIGYDTDTLQIIVGKLLLNKKQTLSIAESCTGGAISSLITSIPGCSEYFKGSIIAYSNEIKMNELKVKHELLVNYGAVSQQVVESMAKGIKEKFDTDYSIAISGIAGPGGGTDDKPIGTVWIAVAGPKNQIKSEKFRFGNQRGRNIQRASIAALNMLRLVLLNAKD